MLIEFKMLWCIRGKLNKIMVNERIYEQRGDKVRCFFRIMMINSAQILWDYVERVAADRAGNTHGNTQGNTCGNTQGNSQGNTQGNTHDQIVTPYINKDKDKTKQRQE